VENRIERAVGGVFLEDVQSPGHVRYKVVVGGGKKKQLLTKEHWLMVHFRNPLMHSYHQAKQPFLDCDVPELGGDIIKTLRVIPRD